jgi:hypothetical protein
MSAPGGAAPAPEAPQNGESHATAAESFERAMASDAHSSEDAEGSREPAADTDVDEG